MLCVNSNQRIGEDEKKILNELLKEYNSIVYNLIC